MLRNQIAKCTTSGFLTGFGGIITMPVTLSANIGSVLYVQMRMIACEAYMNGYELNCDQTQIFVYACLAGVAVNERIKQATIQFGTKGIVNLGKMLPGVGAVIGGGLDLVETKVIADRAYKWFMKGDFSKNKEDEETVVVDATDFEEVEMTDSEG